MKIFNIKKFTLIFFTFLCMFFTVKNVEAEEKYVCDYSLGFYNASNYYKNINLRVTYENGNYSIGTYDISSKSYYDSSTSTLSLYSNSYFVAGNYEKVDDGMHVFISKDTLNQFKTYDFATKKSCPSSVYFLAQMSNNSTDYNLSYYLSSTSLETYGYSNHNDASSCYNTGLCGISAINSSTLGENSNSDSLKNYKKCEYADLSKYVSDSGNIDKLFTLNFNSSNIVIDDYASDLSGKLVPQFQASDLNGECPNALYIGELAGTAAPLSLKSFSGTYAMKVGLIVNFSEDLDSTVEMGICNGSTIKFVSMFYNIIRFLIPIIIIVFSIFDFISVVLSGENEKMEKVKKRFAIRIIIGIAFLFVPSIIELLLKLSGILDNGETLVNVACNIFD